MAKNSYSMKKTSIVVSTLVFILFACSMAQAQANRTFVSGSGNDANPCTRAMPCRSFNIAILRTAIGGEIDVIDTGDYATPNPAFGSVFINQSVTIDGGSEIAGINAAITIGGAAGADAITINVPLSSQDPERRVVLRHLSINGTGFPPSQCPGCTQTMGLKGINATNFSVLDVEDCYIQNFTQAGIDVNLSSNNSHVTVKNTNINRTVVGIQIATSVGFVSGTLDNVKVEHGSSGVIAGDRAYVTVRNSVLDNNTAVAAAIQAPSNLAQLNLENTMIYDNGTGVRAGGPGTTVDLSNTSILNNSTGLATGGGVINSHGNNRIAYNSVPGPPPTLVGQQ